MFELFQAIHAGDVEVFNKLIIQIKDVNTPYILKTDELTQLDIVNKKFYSDSSVSGGCYIIQRTLIEAAVHSLSIQSAEKDKLPRREIVKNLIEEGAVLDELAELRLAHCDGHKLLVYAMAKEKFSETPKFSKYLAYYKDFITYNDQIYLKFKSIEYSDPLKVKIFSIKYLESYIKESHESLSSFIHKQQSESKTINLITKLNVVKSMYSIKQLYEDLMSLTIKGEGEHYLKTGITLCQKLTTQTDISLPIDIMKTIGEYAAYDSLLKNLPSTVELKTIISLLDSVSTQEYESDASSGYRDSFFSDNSDNDYSDNDENFEESDLSSIRQLAVLGDSSDSEAI